MSCPRAAGLQQFFVVVTALFLAAVSLPAQTQTPDDQYLNILSLVDRADTLNEKKQGDLGKAKYTEAARILQQFRLRYPTWNPSVVSFRLNYLTTQINQLSQPSAPPSVAAISQPDARSTAGGASVAVKVLDAGAEPRKALRFQVKPGNQQSLISTIKSSRDMGVTGVMKEPTKKIPMTVTVKEVSADGDITYETLLGEISLEDDADVNPLMAGPMKALFEKLNGLTAVAVVSSRGLGKSAVVKTDGLDAQTRQVVDQIKDSLASGTIPLPEEAVGPGAKWEVKRNVKLQGLTVVQTTTYELVSANGELIELKDTVTQSATNQKIESPMAPGMKVDVTKMTGTGKGSATLDLMQLLPTKSTSEMHTELSASMTLGGQKQAIVIKSDESTVMEAK